MAGGESVGSVERGLLQSRLLCAIFDHAVAGDLALKGGMAMHAVLGSERTTKDIDFAHAEGAPPERVRRAVERGISEALSSGLLEDVRVTAPKQTDTTNRWKINGRAAGSHVQLTIEMKRHPLPEGHIIRRQYLPPVGAGATPTLVESYDAIAMAAAKTAALLSENRSAPRDLYDLALLVELRVDPPVALLANAGVEALSRMQANLWQKLEGMDYPRFCAEVLDFLPRETAARFDEERFEGMRLAVGEALEGWLGAAALRARGERLQRAAGAVDSPKADGAQLGAG
ncbi:putative nucleotidyltransferase component of viral defense system [Natronocella acetinitrilica]|uniref:Nucleotidyltransferase component of viral defense system n=1 Tax=Natronocella acetinitrilica TaxID=414046 RepID=A0AAE3G2F6_9GAMM|nr:nucleotidyl transferase AbiEii/AbiGii toxin family protein [Natronocella acetinitrilica]MCP1674505.1 putative nucleotidyltransferase component of viral defense system [Natronocella acetinitrilica]